MALLFKMLCRRKGMVLLAVCASVLTAAIALWWNARLGGMINQVSSGKALTQQMLSGALTAMLLTGATQFINEYLSGYACQSMAHDLRMGYARAFALLPVIEAEKLNTGEALSRLQNEITGVSGYLSANLFQLFDDGVRFIVTFIWLLCLGPGLTLAANMPALLIVVYAFWSSKIIGSATRKSQAAKAEMNQYADSLLTLFPIIRLYGAARITLKGYTCAVKAWEDETVRAERTRARLLSLSGLLSSIPLLILFLVGGQMVISGTLSVGTLYVFLNLSGNVTGVLMNMPGHIAAFRQFSANMKRLSPHITWPQGGKPVEHCY